MLAGLPPTFGGAGVWIVDCVTIDNVVVVVVVVAVVVVGRRWQVAAGLGQLMRFWPGGPLSWRLFTLQRFSLVTANSVCP